MGNVPEKKLKWKIEHFKIEIQDLKSQIEYLTGELSKQETHMNQLKLENQYLKQKQFLIAQAQNKITADSLI